MTNKKILRRKRINETFSFLATNNIPFVTVNGDIEVHIYHKGKRYKLYPSTQRWCEFGYHTQYGLDTLKNELKSL